MEKALSLLQAAVSRGFWNHRFLEAPMIGPFGSDGKRFLVLLRDSAPNSVPTQVARNASALLARQGR